MKRTKKIDNNLELRTIKALNKKQNFVFNSDKHLILKGSAGTGKTYISSYLAYDEIINSRQYTSLTYIRSAVSTRDIGFLPGTEKEKMRVYESPYIDIATDLFKRGDAYDILKNKNTVQFMPTSFIRGITLKNTVIIVDECQNMTFHELDSIITRVGPNCRLMFCGDTLQSDIPRDSGFNKFSAVLKAMNKFDFIEFGVDDIVRSDLVKEYLIKKDAIYNKT